MRIVGGVNRHREIKWPLDPNTRPTKDMVREAIFSVIQNNVKDAAVLDLFAGSGSFGLESLSRGARSAVFVDSSINAIKVIKENIMNLKIANAEVIKDDYEKVIEKFTAEEKRFDIIFLDPPYDLKIIPQLSNKIITNQLLSKDGILIIETDYELVDEDEKFTKIKKYKYGRTIVTIKWR